MSRYAGVFMLSFSMIFTYTKQHRVKKQIPMACIRNASSSNKTTDVPNITVFVHGTRLFVGSFYRTNFNRKPGLKHARDFPKHKYTYRFLKNLSQCSSAMFPYEHLYYFGWSGLLNVKERDKATEALYDALVECAQKYYDEYNQWPSIRLVCHSHGGNVALSLARIHARKKSQLIIDSLILLACPVQQSTKRFAASPLFKNIYSFYACLDLIQVMAPEITEYVYNDQGDLVNTIRRWYFFSKRRFEASLPVKQARIKINTHSVDHTCFMSPCFLNTLPSLLSAIDEAYAETDDLKYHRKELICTLCKN